MSAPTLPVKPTRKNRAADNPIESPGPDDDLVQVKAGEYLALYIRHAGMVVFRTAKMRVDFQLLAHPDLILSRWYRVQDWRAGRVRAGHHSDIVRELSAVLGRRIRHDRIPINCLENIIVTVDVHEVTSDRKQEKLAEVNCYSVISRIKERAE